MSIRRQLPFSLTRSSGTRQGHVNHPSCALHGIHQLRFVQGSTIYTEAGVDAMNDLNPQLDYKAALEDPYRLKKKSVRGGSWKDPESYIRAAWRTWEYQNQPRSYIGFRCVRSLANTTSTKQKKNKK